MESFSFQNIIDGQAVSISITGMLIVFSGLLLISIYISLLPRILDLFERRSSAAAKLQSQQSIETSKEEAAPSETAQTGVLPADAEVEPVTTEDDEFNDIASVIGLVLQLEHERTAKVDNEQITIVRNENRRSLWGMAGRMRKMPQRRIRAKI